MLLPARSQPHDAETPDRPYSGDPRARSNPGALPQALPAQRGCLSPRRPPGVGRGPGADGAAIGAPTVGQLLSLPEPPPRLAHGRCGNGASARGRQPQLSLQAHTELVYALIRDGPSLRLFGVPKISLISEHAQSLVSGRRHQNGILDDERGVLRRQLGRETNKPLK